MFSAMRSDRLHLEHMYPRLRRLLSADLRNKRLLLLNKSAGILGFSLLVYNSTERPYKHQGRFSLWTTDFSRASP
jgi:hypothetical protein